MKTKTKRKMCNAERFGYHCHLARHSKRETHCDLVKRMRWVEHETELGTKWVKPVWMYG